MSIWDQINAYRESDEYWKSRSLFNGMIASPWHCQRCGDKAIAPSAQEHCYSCCKKDGCKCIWYGLNGIEYQGREIDKWNMQMGDMKNF